MLTPRALLFVALLAAVAFAARPAAAQESWTIRSFDIRYEIDRSGDVRVIEDIRVDFGGLQRHGIFRDVPVQYAYDADNNRVMALSDITVDDGETPVRFDLSSSGPNLRIRIGDPDVLVSGNQRYRISYVLNDGLNPFDDHDELYWNATGDEWEAPIERATASVFVPSPGIERVDCFQGPRGSTTPCISSFDPSSATFASDGPLLTGEGLTFVIGLEKGVIEVGPPVLVDANVTASERVADFLGLGQLSLGFAAFFSTLVLVGVGRLWWLKGRDRWYGDNFYLTADEPARAETRPVFAHQTIVVEYEPPEVGDNGRALRPAEIGVLLDERADTLDVSATIVDLAVRKYLTIVETEKGGIFGMFQSPDYQLLKQEKPDTELLQYERSLLNALFDSDTSVLLSDLKDKFHEDLATVKEKLYSESTSKQKFFARNPEKVRAFYGWVGAGVAAAGGGLAWLLGTQFGVALIALPVIVGGLAILVLSPAMPCRTPKGWHAYRRCLGFRLFMVTAETDRQRFAEEENIFTDYLPYAIVYGCVKKWAEAFEALGLEPRQPDWYVGSRPFRALAFAEGVGSFSTSISSVMASTPGGSGGSGFSGGGSSGGGGGGGGGGSW